MFELWNKCLDSLKRAYNREVFETWIAVIRVDESSSQEDGILRLIAPSSAKAKTIRESYGAKIQDIVNRVSGKKTPIEWSVGKKSPSKPSATASTAKNTETPPVKTPSLDTIAVKDGLLPNLTFENFVQGSANQMVYVAAQRVATSDTAIYNPLFIFGGVGLGKTHIMHAIGHRYLKAHPTARIRCVSAQQYMQEFIEALNQKERHPELIRQFDARYKDLDLLLIDDIQSFGSRDGTQANFFNLFENMVPHGKQIVMTSDTYPRQLDFKERLLSRLLQGLIVEVEPPDQDMRVQILMQKADRSGITMPLEVAEVIAKRLKSNVRELEGAVQQIVAYTNFHNVPVTIETVKTALRDVFSASATPITIEAIQQAVAEYYNLKIADMGSKSRVAPVARARQIAMFLSKELTQKSLPEIGKNFGGRDHATVIHACKKIAEERGINAELKHDLTILEQKIKN